MSGTTAGRNYPNPDDVRRMAGMNAAQIRAHVDEQTCPFCGLGPFKRLAMHTTQKHGVLADDLRFAAGMRWHEPVCDPEYSTRMRGQVNREAVEPNLARARGRNNQPAKGSEEHKRFKERQRAAASARNRALRRLAKLHPEEYDALVREERISESAGQ